jgi:hypothetical protein
MSSATQWLRRIRGAVGMGLTWAVGWALFGVLIGVASILLPGLPWNAFFAVFDAPLPALAVPGFVGGALFSVVLGIAGRHRRFDDLSLPRFAAWGALGGVLLSLVPAAMVTFGQATLRPDLALWPSTAMIAVPLTLLGAASAAGSLLLGRRGRPAVGAGEALRSLGEGEIGAGTPQRRARSEAR